MSTMHGDALWVRSEGQGQLIPFADKRVGGSKASETV